MREMLQTNAHARWLVILGAVMFTASMSFTWLVQPKLLNLGATSDQLVWLYTIQGIFGLLIGELQRLWAKRTANRPKASQRERQPYEAFAGLILAVGFIGNLAGTSNGWPGIAAVLIAPILLRSFADRLQGVLLNRILPNKSKRPVQFSVVSAANNLAFAIIGTVMGLTLGQHEVDAALHIVSICVLWLGGFALFMAYGAAKEK